MSPSGKLCFHPGSDYIQGYLGTKYTASETEHIGIIVLPAHSGSVGLVTEGGPNIAMPISGNGHTYAGTADQDSPFTGRIADTFADLVGKVGIINRVCRKTTDIHNYLTNFLQKLNNKLLKFKTAMITAHCYLHPVLQIRIS